MKYLSLLLLVLATLHISAQDVKLEAPNYKRIKKNIKKEGSNLFYADLLERYKKSDTTLTLQEKRHLYYGFIYHENYSPYASSDYNDSIRVIYKKTTLDTDDFNNLKRFSDSILDKEPFSLRALNYKLYANDELRRIFDFNKDIVKANTVIDAILSTGDGVTKKTAFYVTYVSHEYDLLSILGYQYGGTQSLIEHYDYLTLAKNDNDIEGLYFDISPCLNSLSNMFDD